MNGTYIAEYVFARSAATVVHSLSRIETSHHEIAASRRRAWRTIRGGSASDAETTAARLRALVQLLVNPHEIPRIATGDCLESRRCDICGRQMLTGNKEYEVAFSTLTFRIDADCFALWQEEMLRTAKRHYGSGV
jgi:hypothetical protein